MSVGLTPAIIRIAAPNEGGLILVNFSRASLDKLSICS